MGWYRKIVAAATMTVAVIVALAGCMSAMQTVAADVPPGGWSEPEDLIYIKRDTLTVATVALSLRHSVEVSPSSAAFRVVRLSPWGERHVDTVRIDIPPILFRTGRLHETTAPLSPSRAAFSEPGEWHFTVTPLQTMSGVWSVAIEL